MSIGSCAGIGSAHEFEPVFTPEVIKVSWTKAAVPGTSYIFENDTFVAQVAHFCGIGDDQALDAPRDPEFLPAIMKHIHTEVKTAHVAIQVKGRNNLAHLANTNIITRLKIERLRCGLTLSSSKTIDRGQEKRRCIVASSGQRRGYFAFADISGRDICYVLAEVVPTQRFEITECLSLANIPWASRSFAFDDQLLS